MNTATALYSLALLSHLTTLLGLLVIGTGLYLYTWYAQKRGCQLTALHAIIPPCAAIIGLTFSYTQYYELGLIASLLVFLAARFVQKRWRPFMFHALSCALVTGGGYATDYYRYTLLNTLLSTGQHTIHALVTDIAAWPRSKNGGALTLAVSHIAYQPAPCVIRCYVHRLPAVGVGDMICLYRVQLAPPRIPEKTSLLAYNLRDNMVGCLFTPFLNIRILCKAHPSMRWHCWWHRLRSTLYSRLKQALPSDTFTYLSALFFGNKNCQEYPEVKRLFSSWGITHYLARSGLHIALIIMLWNTLLAGIPIGIAHKQIILLLLLLLYAQVSWSSISFSRALWLWLFYLGATLCYRTSQPAHLLGTITTAIAVLRPAYLLCIDFQLSFFLTAVLMLANYYQKQFFILSSCTK